jgi:hypothetical protein
MNKETLVPQAELETLAASMTEVFVQRRDLYSRQLDDGRYLCIRKPLTDGHVLAHLRGDITLGTYVLDQESQARFIVYDADDDQQMTDLVRTNAELADQGIASYLEQSRRGGHLWLFFSQPVPGNRARRFGRALLAIHDLRDVELFPKQDRLRTGPGSLIRLPFGVHRRNGQRYGFTTADGQHLAPTIREQIRLLCAPCSVSEATLETIEALVPQTQSVSAANIVESRGATVSQKIKDSASVHDFVSRFVELSPSGRGLCPFHDDRRKSFSVNADENYWHCFAGCGGGSLIDFWMKWRDCDFTVALRELAQMLLQDG